MLVGTSIVTVRYLLLNLVYVYALPPIEMRGVMEVAAAAGARLFGPGIGRWLNGAISIGLLSVFSAMILAGPRVYYAMSSDGIFFSFFASVDGKRHTPAHAIGLQAAMAMIVTASFDKLLVYIGFTLSLFTTKKSTDRTNSAYASGRSRVGTIQNEGRFVMSGRIKAMRFSVHRSGFAFIP